MRGLPTQRHTLLVSKLNLDSDDLVTLLTVEQFYWSFQRNNSWFYWFSISFNFTFILIFSFFCLLGALFSISWYKQNSLIWSIFLKSYQYKHLMVASLSICVNRINTFSSIVMLLLLLSKYSVPFHFTSLTMHYLEVLYLVSKYLEIFQRTFCYWLAIYFCVDQTVFLVWPDSFKILRPVL